MTSWHGHRNDPDIPEAVRSVWKRKFDPAHTPRERRQSNVDLAILTSAGQLVHWFDGFHYRGSGRRESLAQYTARELQTGTSWLRLVETPPRLVKKPTLQLPDLIQSRGVRVIVRLEDDRMPAYRAPVVEAVPLESADWKPLAWRDQRHVVDASELQKWLSQVYPPGIMERTNPQTKRVYKIRSVAGTLTLTPAGTNATHRYAVASGSIRLTDEGDDNFRFEGRLDLVLTYNRDAPEVVSLRGVFDGIYPRVERRTGRTRQLPLQAVFESRPQ
ncbi:MAG: hypothetical protein CMJ65_02245 [Planctomycetaceae bacterium]|nr:hypothetical protein [Planctomycetaceae bacterium]